MNKITIYIAHDGEKEKLILDKKKYEINVFEASEFMQKNHNAKCEGMINGVVEGSIFDDDEKKINELMRINNGKIGFFMEKEVF